MLSWWVVVSAVVLPCSARIVAPGGVVGAVGVAGGGQRVLPRRCPAFGGSSPCLKGSPVPDVFVHSHGVVHDWRNRTDRTWHNQSQHAAPDLGKYITCSHEEGGKNNKEKIATKVATATGSGILEA